MSFRPESAEGGCSGESAVLAASVNIAGGRQKDNVTIAVVNPVISDPLNFCRVCSGGWLRFGLANAMIILEAGDCRQILSANHTRDRLSPKSMTMPKGGNFGLPVKWVHKESSTADVVLRDPSASVGMTESQGQCCKRVDATQSLRAIEPLCDLCREETSEYSSVRSECVCQQRNGSSASVISSEVEKSVKRNPAKRLNYGHVHRRCFPVFK